MLVLCEEVYAVELIEDGGVQGVSEDKSCWGGTFFECFRVSMWKIFHTWEEGVLKFMDEHMSSQERLAAWDIV